MILAVVVVVRFVWMYPGTYLPRRLSRRIREREPAPPWTYPIVVSWAGMRGVVSLAAAFALAADFPQRDLILFMTFFVVFGTLVLQGLTLPWLIRRLGVVGREDVTDRLAVMQKGRVVEEGETEQVLTRPQHPYTRMLRDAVPGEARS